MPRLLIFIMLLLLTNTVAHACLHFYKSAPDTIYGDSARARRAYNHAIEDTFSKPVVRLGYLYADTVTLQQFSDNLKVGLRMMGHPEYKIVGYKIDHLPKGRDYYIGIDVDGQYLPYRICRAMGLLYPRPGSRIAISPKVIKDGETRIRYLNDVKIVIR